MHPVPTVLLFLTRVCGHSELLLLLLLFSLPSHFRPVLKLTQERPTILSCSRTAPQQPQSSLLAPPAARGISTAGSSSVQGLSLAAGQGLSLKSGGNVPAPGGNPGAESTAQDGDRIQGSAAERSNPRDNPQVEVEEQSHTGVRKQSQREIQDQCPETSPS